MSTIMRSASRTLPEYVVDNLGGSFKVILVNSARGRIDEVTGKERVDIPDYDGLIGSIAILRVINDRKFSGKDIRFTRKHLGMKAKELASHLDVSPEHLSRCENDEKVLSGNSEKILRLMVLSRPIQVLEKIMADSEKKDDPKTMRLIMGYAEMITDLISKMRIVPISDDLDPLVFKLNFVGTKKSNAGNDNDSDDGTWHHPHLPSAVAA